MQNANYTTQYKDVLPQERDLADITPTQKKLHVDDVYHMPNPFHHDPQERRLRRASSHIGGEPKSSLSKDPGLHRVIDRAQTSQHFERKVSMSAEQMAALTAWLLQAGQTINWERQVETNGREAA